MNPFETYGFVSCWLLLWLVAAVVCCFANTAIVFGFGFLSLLVFAFCGLVSANVAFMGSVLCSRKLLKEKIVPALALLIPLGITGAILVFLVKLVGHRSTGMYIGF